MITLYTIFYNEEVILPFFLNHYSKFVDRFVFYNNQSTDASVEIINNYGLKDFKIINHITNHEIRDDLYLHIKNNAWKDDGSDFVIVCDTDEILYSENIKDVFDSNPNVPFFYTTGYNMVSETVPTDTSLQIYDTIKTGAIAPNYSKVLAFNPKIVKEIYYLPGCHSCYPTGYNGLPLSGIQSNLKVLHYKFLSIDYVNKKHSDYKNRLSQLNLANKWGIHYLDDIERIKRDHAEILNNSNIIL